MGIMYKLKKSGSRIVHCCTMADCVMDSVEFKFNDIISFYTKNDSEQWAETVCQHRSLGYFIFILLLVIINTVAD